MPLNPQGNVACQNRLDRLRSFRKLMLIYRLIHFNDSVQDINTGLKRRNRELSKPILQLFYSCKHEIQTEIKSMLEHFLAIKKHRKENTIEVALYSLITNLVAECGTEIFASAIWDRITAGKLIGHYDAFIYIRYRKHDGCLKGLTIYLHYWRLSKSLISFAPLHSRTKSTANSSI